MGYSLSGEGDFKVYKNEKNEKCKEKKKLTCYARRKINGPPPRMSNRIRAELCVRQPVCLLWACFVSLDSGGWWWTVGGVGGGETEKAGGDCL